MLPSDPERDAVGRSIAAILMAKEIKRDGGIHAETIMTEIGALAGFAAQMSIRKEIIAPQKLDPDAVLVELVAKNSERYYFSDLLNCILFENLSTPPYSVWAYVLGAVGDQDHELLPDLADIVSHAARSVGTKQFGVPRLPSAHMPRRLPRAALHDDWALVQRELIAAGREPAEWPYDLALAARWQITTSGDKLAPLLAAKIVMEAAIPMSKVDPRTVPGA